jgi:protein TonB
VTHDPPLPCSPRIVDLVFAPEPTGRRRRWGIGVGVVLMLYGGVFASVNRLGGSLGRWGAEVAARVHDAIAMERAIDVTPPPPPPSSVEPARAAARVTHASHVAHTRPAPPAKAGQIVAAAPDPIDFTGSAFIVGSGPSYAGGATTSTGIGRKPALGPVGPGDTGRPAAAVRSRARAVSLDQSAWNCPWPAEADAQQVDEQTVVLRANVRADGKADDVDVVTDPGFGFGSAARLCALATHFEPARDANGQPIAAQSPPIRVHFFR